MKPFKSLFAVVVGLIAVIGYFGYQWIKNDPPDWLVKIVASPSPPPELPGGDAAPFQVAEGFTARIFSRETPGARVMTRDPKGTLVVSLMKEGKVVALPNLNGDGEADEVKTILTGLTSPHGLYFYCPSTGLPQQAGNASAQQDACRLYVGETGQVVSYAYDGDTYTASDPKTITTLPTAGGGHFTRTLLPHPDGKRLLVSVGSSCNVCVEQDERRASILAIDLATNKVTPYATGLRNTVFMAISYVTGEIWGTDNGRDLIGDDIPPDELNVIRQGSDYGWPLCYGKNIYDTDFDGATSGVCKEPAHRPSTYDLQAHSAALGLAFIPEEGWPEEYMSDLLVAFHGSWNRSQPTGYKVVRFDISADGRRVEGGPFDFLTGFLAPDADEDEARGRPVGVLAEPGGTVYVSDDHAGAIYRITRNSLD